MVVRAETVVETNDKLTNRLRRGYNILFESQLLMEFDDTPDKERLLEYVRTNERTALIEAVMQGMLAVTYQTFSPEFGQFVAYGEPLEELLARGLATKCDDFEYKRRLAELKDEQNSGEAFRVGTNSSRLFISPYPEEVDPGLAASYGYNPVDTTMMIRAFETDEFGRRTTYQLAISNSSIPLLNEFFHYMGIAAEAESATELMEMSEYLTFGQEPGAELVVRAARVYDALLKLHDPHNRNFFLGVPVEYERQQTYDSIIGNYKLLEDVLEPHVEHLVAFDKQLAVRLKAGTISNEEASALKEKELVRVWTLVSMLVRGERAEGVFGEGRVLEVRNAYIAGDYGKSWEIVDEAILFAQPLYYICGGSFVPLSEGFINSGVMASVFGGPASELYTWVCEQCGMVHDINVPMGRLKEKCDRCGKSGRC